MNEQLVVQVSGMSCRGCESRIGNALARVDGVRRSRADHQTGQVRVAFDPATVSAETVRARIEALGYPVLASGDDH